jgi:hypothetical protein
MHKRVIDFYERSAGAQYVVIGDGVAMLGNEQLAEPMLCNACEAIIEPAERCVSEIALQADDTFPALENILDASHLKPGSVPLPVKVPFLDTSALARFAASVVWRAAVSKKCSTSLGPYAETLRAYLLDSGARLPAGVHVVTFVHDGRGVNGRPDHALLSPSASRALGCHWHAFSGCGFRFVTSVGGCWPAFLPDLCVERSGVAVLGMADMLLEHVLPLHRAAIPKGKVARQLQDARPGVSNGR